jgi:hypothetical protein
MISNFLSLSDVTFRLAPYNAVKRKEGFFTSQITGGRQTL